MTTLPSNCILALYLLSIACNATPPANTGKTVASPSTAATSAAASATTSSNPYVRSIKPVSKNRGTPTDDLHVFATSGHKILAPKVILLIRDANGQLQKVERNDKLVPCAQCGGIAGDPFSYLQITSNGLLVVTEGGSRQHWSNEYTFTYSVQHIDWLISSLKREVTDQDTGKHKQIDLSTYNIIAYA